MDKECDTCKRGEEFSLAKYWCNSCLEALCETCNFYHKRMKNTSTHTVILVGEKSESDLKLDVDEPCLEHQGKGEVLKLYCLDHEKLCCQSCISQSHRKCRNVFSVDEMAETMAGEENILDMTKKLGEIEAKTKVLTSGKTQTVDWLDKKYQQMSNTVAVLIGNAKARIDKFHIDFKENLLAMHNDQKDQINDRKKSIERFQKAVRDDRKVIQTILNQGSSRQLFIATEKVKSQLNSHAEQLQQDLQDDQNVDYELRMADVLNKVTAALKSSVEVKVTTQPYSNNAVGDIMDVVEKLCHINETKNHDKEPEMNDILDFIEEVSYKEPLKVAEIHLKGSRFHSGLFLSDGRLLFPDYNYEKLKIYDISGSFIFDFPLYRRPWDVACNSIGEIFVSFPNIMCIKKYRLNQNYFCELGAIDTNNSRINGFDGILGNHVIAASDNNVIVLGPDGKVVKTILVSTNGQQIATSWTELRYYFTDGDIIKSNSLNGKQLSCYSYPEIKNPISLSVNTSGRVYVCCYKAKSLFIHQISENGIRTLVSKLTEVDEPRNVIFEPDGNYFILVYHTGSNFKGRTQRSCDLLNIPESGLEAGIAKIYKMPLRKLETQL